MSEKANGNLSSNGEVEHPLHRENTVISITPEMFEKMYLSPKNHVRPELRHTFANPTPVAVLGFCVALTPLSIELMGWRGAGGLSATVGGNYFYGGMLLILGGIGEFLLGNTFPCAVFMAYGAHFFTLGSTFTPWFAAISSYSTDGSQTQTPTFQAGFGFYCLALTLLTLVFLVCSVRTNVGFVVVFTSATLGFAFATAAFWHLAEADAVVGSQMLVGSGACFFVASMAGWYLLFAMMLTTVDMPFSVPVGDLSTVIKGRRDLKKDEEA